MGTFVTTLIIVVRALLLLLAGASISLVVLASSTSGGSRPVDPFASYADLLLLEPPDEFISRGFNCTVEFAPKFAWNCTLNPPTGTFADIQVRIAYGDDGISQVTYRPRQNALSLGDLVLLWGTPEVSLASGRVNFNWPDVHARATAATNDTQRISYFLPVSTLSMNFLHPS
jgi:hypothetical protein